MFGVVSLEGAVVTITQPISIHLDASLGPYGTVEGVEAIARGLAPR